MDSIQDARDCRDARGRCGRSRFRGRRMATGRSKSSRFLLRDASDSFFRHREKRTSNGFSPGMPGMLPPFVERVFSATLDDDDDDDDDDSGGGGGGDGPPLCRASGPLVSRNGTRSYSESVFFFWKINSFISLFARAAPFAGPANGDEYGARNAHWDKKGNGSTVVALSTDPDRQLGKRTKKPSKQCRTQSTHRRARTDFSHGTNPSSNESNLLICSLYYNTIVLCQQKHRVSVNHEGRCTSRVRWEN